MQFAYLQSEAKMKANLQHNLSCRLNYQDMISILTLRKLYTSNINKACTLYGLNSTKNEKKKKSDTPHIYKTNKYSTVECGFQTRHA